MEFCNSTIMLCPKWCLMSNMCPITEEGKQITSALPYCAIISKCMYLSTCTCPDISYAICELAHFMSNYSMENVISMPQSISFGTSKGPAPRVLFMVKCQTLSLYFVLSQTLTGPCLREGNLSLVLSLNVPVPPLLGALNSKPSLPSHLVRPNILHAKSHG